MSRTGQCDYPACMRDILCYIGGWCLLIAAEFMLAFAIIAAWGGFMQLVKPLVTRVLTQ